jgi:uncharacterized protein YgfB (UPF0149 family)
MTTVTWADWSAALARRQLGVTPAELHGSVTGYLCAGRVGGARELLVALALEDDDTPAGGCLDAMLDTAASDIRAKLQAGIPVDPLIPDASVSVGAAAMVDWCRGFLGGLGLAGISQTHGQTPEVKQVLADFGHIAATHFASGDDDAASLAEVLDFIRAGVLVLHAHFMPMDRS